MFVSVVLFSLCTTLVVCDLPDFSRDRYTEDIWDASESKYISEVRYDNEDKPRHCRIDICTSEIQHTPKGTFLWFDTQLETRLNVRCPYSVQSPVYAYRDCLYLPEAYNNTARPGINNSYSEWNYPEYLHCPDPPLQELLRKLHEEELSFERKPIISWYSKAILRIHHIMTSYRDAPVRYQDICDVSAFMGRAVISALEQSAVFSSVHVEKSIEVFNEVFLLDTVNKALVYCNIQKDRILEAIIVLAEMWTPTSDDETEISIILDTLSITSVRAYTGLNYTKTVFNTTVVSTVVHQTGSSDDVLHIAAIQHTQWLQPNIVGRSGSKIHKDTENITTIPPDTYDYYVFTPPVVYVSMSQDPRHSGDQLQLWHNEDGRRITVNVTNGVDGHIYKFDSHCVGIDIYRDFHGNITNFKGTDWYIPNCIRTWSAVDIGCQCTHQGFYGLFVMVEYPAAAKTTTMPLQTDMATTTTISTSFSEFLGFPYNYELYITGQIMRAISIVCLIVTIIAHVVFRKGKMSKPTRILLNLCISLILLNLILYIAEAVAHERWGCRISNILRYYLIMVSLAWNVTEAVNLYLMLVRVFKSHVSHFVLKAAILAWGLPVLPIVIVLSIDDRGFDGKYFFDCSQKCVLKDPVFYFAYLLPLGIMVLGNTVIFILVVRVLRNHKTGSDGRRFSGMKQLQGAVSMMFLLGIPWVFSAFGALNEIPHNETVSLLTGICQVIGIVFISLQGAFIFIFHCVKNSDVKNQWKAALSSWKQDGSGASVGKSTGKDSRQYPDTGHHHTDNSTSKTQSTVVSSSTDTNIERTPL